MLLKFSTTRKFDKQFKNISSIIQKIFIKKLEYLLNNQKHPSLHIEKLNYNLCSFRINKNFRVIYKYSNTNEIELIFIANHNIYKKIKNL